MIARPRWILMLEEVLRHARLPISRVDALHNRLEIALQPAAGNELVAQVIPRSDGLQGWGTTDRYVICMQGARSLSTAEERLLKRVMRLLKRVEHKLPEKFGHLIDDGPLAGLPGSGLPEAYGGTHDTLLTVEGPCNLACLYCRFYEGPAAGEPDAHIATITEQLDRLAKAGIDHVVWGSGDFEPTTFAHFPELVSRAKQRGFLHQRLLSNGVRTADRDYLQDLADRGLTELLLSVAEPDAPTGDLLCGSTGVLAAKRATLANCAAVKIDAHVQLLLVRANYQRFADIVEAYAPVNQRRTFMLQMLTHTSPEFAEWFVPPASGVLQVVREAAGRWPDVRFVFTNMPDCLVPLQAPVPDNVLFVPVAAAQEEVPRCADCKENSRCSGFADPRYLEFYGTRELDGEIIHNPVDLQTLDRYLKENAPFASPS